MLQTCCSSTAGRNSRLPMLLSAGHQVIVSAASQVTAIWPRVTAFDVATQVAADSVHDHSMRVGDFPTHDIDLSPIYRLPQAW